MSLKEKCANLQLRLDNLKRSQETVDESDALSKRLSEARVLRDKVKIAFEKIHLLKENGIEIGTTVINQIDPMAPLDKIIERFNENPVAASLTKGRDWTKLQEQGVEWQKKSEIEASRSWKSFVDKQCRGQTPDGLQATLAQTKTNKIALEKFSLTYRSMQALKNEFPTDSGTIGRVSDLSNELKRASEAFDYDVPEDVKAFLAAINKGGASLNLLTQEVLSWLSRNKSESQYQIVGR